MTLAIRKMVTTCRVSPRRRDAATIVDRIARERFPAELAAYLGPSLANQPEIVRIRQLRLRVTIPPGPVNDSTITSAWVAAFGSALFQALAYPDGKGPVEVARAATRAQFIAGLLREITDGFAAQRWQYAEFADLLHLPASEAMLAILQEESPLELLPIFAELQSACALERVIARLDEPALAQLFAQFDAVLQTGQIPIAADSIVFAARLLLEHGVPRGWKTSSRSTALRLFVLSIKPAPTSSPRLVARALGIIVSLLENPWLGEGRASLSDLAITPQMKEVIDMFPEGLAPDLAPLIEQLRPLVPTAAPPSAKPRPWVHSECAGVFLLTGLVLRSVPKPHPFLVAGIALAVLGRLDPDIQAIEAGIAGFAGFDELPAMAAFRAFLSEEGRIQELNLRAGEVIRAFTDYVPGFRRASRDAIVRQFLAKPGRFRVEDLRVLVALEASPFHLALRIGGADSAVESVPWLGGRRLEFLLEGL